MASPPDPRLVLPPMPGGRTALLFTGPEQVESIDLLLVVSLSETTQGADSN